MVGGKQPPKAPPPQKPVEDVSKTEVEPTPKPEAPKPPKLKGPMNESDLQEWEAYFDKYDVETGPNRPDLALMAGVGLMLLELVKRK